MKLRLDSLLKTTIEECFKRGLLKKTPLPAYTIEAPNNTAHGHFATNLPLTLATGRKRPPREIASILIEHIIDNDNLLEKAEVAGPGFINFWVNPDKWYQVLSEIVSLREHYGRNKMGKDEKVLVEFVSANPTGPLHLGHGRGAALGDTLCRILSFCGYDVAREFYINDAGQQIRLLGESIFSRFKQMQDPGYPFPEKGYHGDYIQELAKKISQEVSLNALSEDETLNICIEKGKAIMLDEIRHVLSRFRVKFDYWTNESDLVNSGLVKDNLEMIKKKGYLYEKDGATWIKTSDFGDDKDRVIRKKDGFLTYFASDISYHLEKKKRGFDKAINLWGADHHGYVPRMKAALKAQGLPENWLSVLLIQLVKLWKDGNEIKMSKRAGNFVSLDELLNEVGVDAARFIFLIKNHDSTLDFDIDLVKKLDSNNPVYYVQYAHARICSIFRKAVSEGISMPDPPEILLDRLVLNEEMQMIRQMEEFPSLLKDICRSLEPHRLTSYLSLLSASFHKYFNLGTKIPEHRIVTDDKELSRARLCLVDAVRIITAKCLNLLGITAPEEM